MSKKKSGVFTNDQLKRMANILDNLGQVLVATIILPPLIRGVASVDLNVVVLGLIVTLGFWWTSLRLERMSS